MSVLSMKEALEAGAHFGHQTKRWNPKMGLYIYGARNGIYIIDLQKTVKLFRSAHDFVMNTVARGGEVLFVGTKKQAQGVIAAEATRCEMHSVTNRWLGGTLTNFKTISRGIKRLKDLQKMENEGNYADMTKKEILQLHRERMRLEKTLSGIQNMEKLPKILFVVDPRKERIAVHEAHKLNIPVVAIVDTNCDPDDVDWVIPANDDAIRSVGLFTGKIADAVIEGRQVHDERMRGGGEDRPQVTGGGRLSSYSTSNEGGTATKDAAAEAIIERRAAPQAPEGEAEAPAEASEEKKD